MTDFIKWRETYLKTTKISIINRLRYLFEKRKRGKEKVHCNKCKKDYKKSELIEYTFYLDPLGCPNCMDFYYLNKQVNPIDYSERIKRMIKAEEGYQKGISEEIEYYSEYYSD